VLSLFFRNLVFTILQPGLVAGLFPWLIVRHMAGPQAPFPTGPAYYLGIVMAVSGVVLTLYCIYLFMHVGRGTLSPADPTRHLVDRGVYRYSRNPMYIGVLLVLLGQALYTGYWQLAAYAAILFLVFNGFIVLLEEPRLRRDFGADYDRYCARVNRWLGRKSGEA